MKSGIRVKIMVTYLCIISLLNFSLFLADSKLNVKIWLLLLITLFGGTVGALLGVKALKSKKKNYFFIGVIPAIVLMQITGWIMYINLPLRI